MAITVYVTDDFEHMSAVGADIVKAHIVRTLKQKREVVLGLATGNSPTGLYRHLARAANAGELDSRRIRSFNLDEYVGLPGENAQQRVLHGVLGEVEVAGAQHPGEAGHDAPRLLPEQVRDELIRAARHPYPPTP